MKTKLGFCSALVLTAMVIGCASDPKSTGTASTGGSGAGGSGAGGATGADCPTNPPAKLSDFEAESPLELEPESELLPLDSFDSLESRAAERFEEESRLSVL